MSQELTERNKWHLRFGITSHCNFRCIYCNPNGLAELENDLKSEEILQITQAAYNCGIRRIHWTGGEPTIRRDFCNLVKGAKKIGFTQQIVTTNGYKLHKIIGKLTENGLTRVIVSLDTLSHNRYKSLTGMAFLNETLKSIKACAKELPTLTKISVVTMKSTLSELKEFVMIVKEINEDCYKGKVAIKLNQFFPCNPAQLTANGQEYWRKEFVSEKEILETLSAISSLKLLQKENIEGDNPSYRYYLIGDTGVIVGILAMFSWNYPCGRCYKLRMLPFGKVSVCLNQKDTYDLKGRTLKEQTEIFRNAMAFREQLDQIMPYRNHYRAQLGEMRFGKTNAPIPMDFFYTFTRDSV